MQKSTVQCGKRHSDAPMASKKRGANFSAPPTRSNWSNMLPSCDNNRAAAWSATFAEQGTRVDYLVGTMIELPRAALMAGEIAEEGAFFSFGTNDLTQTTLGVSRDDAGRFLAPYVDKGIFPRDPFVSIDIEGVGQLVELAAERGRATRPDIKLGICGEHGGDPASIAFCEKVRLDYVSASPYRVPIARLAAAQAALKA